MSDYPCVADCTARNQHADDCEDRDECQGCVPRRAISGLMLCRYHLERLRQAVAEMPALHDELTASLVRAGSSGDAVRVSQGLSLEPSVLAARDHIVNDLRSWARVVIEERGLRGPRRDDPSSVATWLLQHVEWLAGSPYADEVVRDFTTTRAEALAARQASDARRIELKMPNGTPVRCTEPAEGPLLPGQMRLTCNGTLTAIIRPEAAMLPGVLTCSAYSGHKTGPTDWHLIGRRAGVPFSPGAVKGLMAALAGRSVDKPQSA